LKKESLLAPSSGVAKILDESIRILEGPNCRRRSPDCRFHYYWSYQIPRRINLISAVTLWIQLRILYFTTGKQKTSIYFAWRNRNTFMFFET